MKINNYKDYAFIFDHDGVIADTEKLHEKVWFGLFKKYGIKVSKKEYDNNARGRSTKDIIKRYFSKLNEIEKSKIPDTKKVDFIKLFKKHYKTIPGIKHFINAASEKGIKMAIATSGKKERAYFSLKKIEATNLIKVIVSGEDVKESKPNPDIFLQAIKRLEVKPRNTIIFEDALSGLRAAKAAGAKVVYVNSSDIKVSPNNYNFEIKDFSRVLPETFVTT